ncbi:prepilin peptidase [Corynebacterium tapiri]|uniref:Prepilin peptidase n=1 Tax=Corynebacterium tapiri TaxID=1448266 RepID=A0A5C4U477_9CORY|nr:A24 family peptidase [Corynebacterium tapiri]TNL97770.1 prepilin peptidase [Corynebacterium tapiri]
MGLIILSIWAIYLALFDATFKRLPNGLTLPPAIASVVCLGLWDVPTLLWSLVWPVLYLVVGLTLDGIGGGDLKLSVSLGALMSAIGGMWAVLGAIVLASVTSLGLLLHKGHGPHGPSMLLATAIVMLWNVHS